MPDFCLPSPVLRRRHYGRKFKKRAVELNAAAAAAVPGGPRSSSAGPTDSLSAADLAGSFEPTAAASAPSGNLIKNCFEFCDLGQYCQNTGLTALSASPSASSAAFLFLYVLSLFAFLYLFGSLQPSCGFEKCLWWHVSHLDRCKSIISGLVSMTDAFRTLQRLILLGQYLLTSAVPLMRRRRWHSDLFWSLQLSLALPAAYAPCCFAFF